MHYLLIPYTLLSVAFILQFHMRQDASAKAGLVFTAAATLALMFLAMTFRPIEGDSWRYYEYFKYVYIRGWDAAFALREKEPLWVLLNWLVGFFGNSAWMLFSGVLIVYMTAFVVAAKRLVGPVGAAILIMCYAAFPYFVAYAANGLRQGLALAFLLMAYVSFRQEKRSAWVWLLLAPLWHSGSLLACAVVVAHWLMCRWITSDRMRWLLVLLALFASVALSISGINQSLLSSYAESSELAQGREIYFTNADLYGYRAGFRADFFLFSLVPLISAWLLRKRSPTFSYAGSGWWLSLYLSLNVIYHLFSFAPFTDRFAAYSWFLMPLVVFLQVRDTRSVGLMTAFVSGICLIDVAMLQLYTGGFLREPGWW